jgi:hypothetical protein
LTSLGQSQSYFPSLKPTGEEQFDLLHYRFLSRVDQSKDVEGNQALQRSADNRVENTSAWVRPLILTGGALLVLTCSLKLAPEAWGWTIADLGWQQATILLLLFSASLNASIFLATRASAGLGAGLILLATDLILVTGTSLAANGQRSWFVAGYIVAVAATSLTSPRFLSLVAMLVGSALYISLPTLESLLGKSGEARSFLEQSATVGMILAAGIVSLGAGPGALANDSMGKGWTRVLSLALPCVLLGMLDHSAGIVVAIPVMIVAAIIQSEQPGLVSRSFAHLIAWGTALAAIGAAFATIKTGVLLVDSLVPRLLERVTQRFPQIQQPAVMWGLFFLAVWILTNLTLRALWPVRKNQT